MIASHNAGKLREIADLVAPFGVTAVSAGSLGLPEPEETGATFQANAELKAIAAYRHMANAALELNLEPIRTYLDSGLVDGQEETFFKDVFRFKPGHTMVVREGLIRGYRGTYLGR